MITNFTVPQNIIIGFNAIEESQNIIASFGKKALIVTGNQVLSLNKLDKIKNKLKNLNIDYHIFARTAGEPTDIMVKEGVDIYKKNNCDFIIAVGGGSPIDLMKAIAIMTQNNNGLSSYMGSEIKIKVPNMIAIPTTAGTGSEATKFTIITDTKNDVKMLLKGDVLIPKIAIIDPELILNTPPNITAASGLDALTHAIEAYTSKKANDLSDMFALSAVKKIFKFLPILFDEPNNKIAAEMMAKASLEAGIAFNNSSVTLVHGMSRPIGALFHVPHGISNAMLLSECLNFALDGAIERFVQLAKNIDCKISNDDKETAKTFLLETEKLCKHCKIPTLEQYGIDKNKFLSLIDKMADDALISGSPSNTRKLITKEDIIKLYHNLWK